jgi:hypothetical protein
MTLGIVSDIYLGAVRGTIKAFDAIRQGFRGTVSVMRAAIDIAESYRHDPDDSYVPRRVVHLARFGRTFRVRKKNQRRIERSNARRKGL